MAKSSASRFKTPLKIAATDGSGKTAGCTTQRSDAGKKHKRDSRGDQRRTKEERQFEEIIPLETVRFTVGKQRLPSKCGY